MTTRCVGSSAPTRPATSRPTRSMPGQRASRAPWQASTPRRGGASVPAVRRLLPTAVALCLLTPTVALASGEDVINDCTLDGRLSKKYSQKEYAQALGDIPTDVDEYTDCRDVIRRAQLGDTSGGGSSNNGGGVGGVPGATGG